ncbi:ABC transporter substrate-binding protein [Betaproteobacteria bacterium SCGC AG-212-J23]|nr:ABC transporter substrate-binding protein [Betaproteobacteria bacterium SCGC AG-212-J23]
MKRIFILLALLLALPAQGTTLRWAAQNDILTFDPHSQNHTTTITLVMHVYESLTRYGKKYDIEPSLATDWKQISPTQWRFNLRKNVKFHDGTPFTADDVIFSYGRIKQPQGTMQIYVDGVKEVRRIDDHTVDFILAGPDPVLLRKLTDFRIMSKVWSEKNRAQNVQDAKAKEESYASRNANGTGAYILKGWEPDKRLVLAANPAWWDKREGNVTDVVYTPIKADATRVSALLAGDVDLVTDLPTQDVARLKQNAALKVLEGHEVRTIFIGLDQFNNELQYSDVKGKNPFKDVRVRRALNLAVDREAIKRVTMRGLSIPAAIMVAPGVHGHTAELDKVSGADPVAARKLLAEAGYPNGFEFTLDCPNNRYVNDEEICQALVGMWAKAGVRAKLNAIPFATHIPKILKHDTSAYMLGWGVATFDSLYTLQSLVRTQTTGADGSFNCGRVSDAKLDALIDAMKTELDVKKRDAMIREALVRVRDEAFYVPLHHQLRPWAMKKNVTTLHRADDRPEARFARVD